MHNHKCLPFDTSIKSRFSRREDKLTCISIGLDGGETLATVKGDEEEDNQRG